MKHISIIILLFFSLGFAGRGFSQCDSNQISEASIKEIPTDYTFLKTFKIDGQGGSKDKVEYSYVFSKDTNYSINISALGAEGSNTDGIIVSMYDAKRHRVATNFVDGNIYSVIQYLCSATGIYYITFTFQNSTNYCGGCALGFKR